jgi:hypothetical protein
MTPTESYPICRRCLNFVGPGEACKCEKPVLIGALPALPPVSRPLVVLVGSNERRGR